MTITTEPRSAMDDPMNMPFDGYTPELARQLEERADEIDHLIAIAFHLSARLSPYVLDREQIINVVVEDVGQRYRSHRERTPHPVSVAQFVDDYVSQVEAAEAEASPAEVWANHIERLDTVLVPLDRPPSGVSRRLRCTDSCCIDNPHADMDLLVGGEVIGGTRYEPDAQWVSWGPAGRSTGHSTRSEAEIAQLNTYRTRH